MPIRPLSLAFNAPVPRKLAEGIRLAAGGSSFEPVFEQKGGGADSLVNGVSFQTVLPEQTKFALELPKDLKDASGRVLRNTDCFPLQVATGEVLDAIRLEIRGAGVKRLP